MQANSDLQCILERLTLRKQRTEHAGKYVARTAACEPGIAAGIDRPPAVGEREHAARALEHDAGAELRGDLEARKTTGSTLLMP